jgi:hypothetical protein
MSSTTMSCWLRHCSNLCSPSTSSNAHLPRLSNTGAHCFLLTDGHRVLPALGARWLTCKLPQYIITLGRYLGSKPCLPFSNLFDPGSASKPSERCCNQHMAPFTGASAGSRSASTCQMRLRDLACTRSLAALAIVLVTALTGGNLCCAPAVKASEGRWQLSSTSTQHALPERYQWATVDAVTALGARASL